MDNLFFIIMLVIAVADVAIAVWFAKQAMQEKSRIKQLLTGPSTQGTVASVQRRVESSGGGAATGIVAPSPIETIEFHDSLGNVVRESPTWRDRRVGDREGEAVTVYFDRDRPERFIAPADGRSFPSPSADSKLKAAGTMMISAVIIAVMAVVLFL